MKYDPTHVEIQRRAAGALGDMCDSGSVKEVRLAVSGKLDIFLELHRTCADSRLIEAIERVQAAMAAM